MLGYRGFRHPLILTFFQAYKVKKVFIFKRLQYWSNAANWNLNYRPSNPLPAGSKVLIDHAPGGNCTLDVPFDLTEGVNLEIAPGKKLIIPPKAN